MHRWIAEKMLGKKLKPNEVVHHINEDKLDNNPDNLAVLPDQDTHERIHGYKNKKGWNILTKMMDMMMTMMTMIIFRKL